MQRYELPQDNLLRTSSLVDDWPFDERQKAERKYHIARSHAQTMAHKIATDKVQEIPRGDGLIEYRTELYVLSPEELLKLIRKEGSRYARLKQYVQADFTN